jgi:hypothetical protein
MRHSRFAWLILALLLAQAPAWADGAHPDPGYLRQTVLVILRFPPAGAADELTLADESSIAAELNIASDFLWTQSDQSLRVNFHVVKMLKPLAASDYKNYGTAGYVGMFNKPVAEFLLHRHINPRKYAGIVMIYRPTNAPGGLFYNTWIWFTDEIPSLASQKKHPGFSSIFYSSTYNPGWLSELLVHEYLHQLDHRFDKEAHNPDGFMNADDKTNPPGLQLEVLLGTTFPSNPSWYAAMLKYYLGPLNTLHRVNYRWLDGIRGVVFKPGELKTSYDFARLYDTLERVSGDDISLANPENPASFRHANGLWALPAQAGRLQLRDRPRRLHLSSARRLLRQPGQRGGQTNRRRDLCARTPGIRDEPQSDHPRHACRSRGLPDRLYEGQPAGRRRGR